MLGDVKSLQRFTAGGLGGSYSEVVWASPLDWSWEVGLWQGFFAVLYILDRCRPSIAL